jgi:hypothetical protein
LLLYAASGENATFSYQHAWPRHFRAHPRFHCTSVNLGGPSLATRLAAEARIRAWRGDAFVLLHSVFSNECRLMGRLFDAVRALARPKAFFIGNEYKSMPEKMRFAEVLRIALLVSQSQSARVHALYRDRLSCEVIGIPNTGFDAARFTCVVPFDARPIDLGYRADDSPWYLGHAERRNIADYFIAAALRYGLEVDISLDPARRLDEAGWAAFLNRCRGQIGTEAGGDFFELTDATRTQVNAFMAGHPAASFGEVWARFFQDYPNPVPLRILSGRNVEAAGTRSVQLLFDGDYDGYFQPNVHYIPLHKDFSNVDEAICKFRDDAFCRTIVSNAHRLVSTEFTYDRLIDRFADALAPLV